MENETKKKGKIVLLKSEAEPVKIRAHNRLKLNNAIPPPATSPLQFPNPNYFISIKSNQRRRSDLTMRINGVETAMIQRPVHPPPPLREDCWNEEATYTLIEAWGDRHIMLNRGNLRQKHWQEVADTVNAHHGTTKKSRRTDVQCKNRIDTIKKKYKSEKARIWSSDGTLTSNWPFYYRLDSLIGTPSSSSKKRKKKKIPYEEEVPVPIPISTTRLGKEKRSVRTIGGGVDDDSFFRKKYFAVAAAAAAAAAAKTDSESSRSSTERSRKRKNEEEEEEVDGVKELARAIGKLGEIYKRVEEEKQRQFIELEKQRMEFMKSLEFERMQFYMDTQIQLEKIKRSERATENDCYLSLSMRDKA